MYDKAEDAVPLKSKPQSDSKPVPKRSKSVSRDLVVPKKPPVALRTCNVVLKNCTVELVEGQPVVGLTSPEFKHLKRHKFIK
jgi:hypothetical protein